MAKKFHKISTLLELLFNGPFVLSFFLYKNNKFPATWNVKYIEQALNILLYIAPFIIFLSVISNILTSKNINTFLRKHSFSLILFVPCLILYGDAEFTFLLTTSHLLSTILLSYGNNSQEKNYPSSKLNIFLKKIRPSSAQMLLVSFIAVILCGTFALMLPVSTLGNKGISFINALFMSTSATCVTGLSTLSISDTFSFFGQMVLLSLIQIGGISIMTLYSSMAILLGRTMRMKDRIIMQDLLNVFSLEELYAMIVNIVKYTFFIELWGTIILTVAFSLEGFGIEKALYYAIFHSISAFCNAGFALFNNSLESYATTPLIHGTISVLVTLGGLGFIVLKELKEVVTKGKSIIRLGMHTKIVLVTSLSLTITGTVIIFFGEFLGALDEYSLWEKIQIATFQSITVRTAGFNTIPITNLNSFTLYIMSLFMFIGGSPGSTAGGVKTTTLAILVQSIKSTLKGEKTVNLFNRVIPSPLVVKVTALMFISILITSLFIYVLMVLEPQQSFLPIFFEVISASGTVGLTLGITPYLSTLGKLALSILMLVGRIGPLTLLIAIGEKQKPSGKFDYPDGRIMIG